LAISDCKDTKKAAKRRSFVFFFYEISVLWKLAKRIIRKRMKRAT